jgi:hypothetical protein
LGVTWDALATSWCAGMPGEHTSPWYLRDSKPGLYFSWRSQPTLDIVVRSAPPPTGADTRGYMRLQLRLLPGRGCSARALTHYCRLDRPATLPHYCLAASCLMRRPAILHVAATDNAKQASRHSRELRARCHMEPLRMLPRCSFCVQDLEQAMAARQLLPARHELSTRVAQIGERLRSAVAAGALAAPGTTTSAASSGAST